MNVSQVKQTVKQRINALNKVMQTLKAGEELNEAYWLYDARLNELQKLLKLLESK